MNLVGHDIELVKELKIHMIKKLNEYNEDGFIKEDKFEELLEKESNALDQRIEVMSKWL